MHRVSLDSDSLLIAEFLQFKALRVIIVCRVHAVHKGLQMLVILIPLFNYGLPVDRCKLNQRALGLVQPWRGLLVLVIYFDVEIRALREPHVFLQKLPLKTSLRLCAPKGLEWVLLGCWHVANISLSQTPPEPLLGLGAVLALDVRRLSLGVSQAESRDGGVEGP